jgi:hypothetical protein
MDRLPAIIPPIPEPDLPPVMPQGGALPRRTRPAFVRGCSMGLHLPITFISVWMAALPAMWIEKQLRIEITRFQMIGVFAGTYLIQWLTILIGIWLINRCGHKCH